MPPCGKRSSRLYNTAAATGLPQNISPYVKKYIYIYFSKARMEVEDPFVDLADGKRLLKLLEIISGEKLAKPNNGKMRVHKIENVNKSLAFLHTKVNTNNRYKLLK